MLRPAVRIARRRLVPNRLRDFSTCEAESKDKRRLQTYTSHLRFVACVYPGAHAHASRQSKFWNKYDSGATTAADSEGDTQTARTVVAAPKRRPALTVLSSTAALAFVLREHVKGLMWVQ